MRFSIFLDLERFFQGLSLSCWRRCSRCSIWSLKVAIDCHFLSSLLSLLMLTICSHFRNSSCCCFVNSSQSILAGPSSSRCRMLLLMLSTSGAMWLCVYSAVSATLTRMLRSSCQMLSCQRIMLFSLVVIIFVATTRINTIAATENIITLASNLVISHSSFLTSTNLTSIGSSSHFNSGNNLESTYITS